MLMKVKVENGKIIQSNGDAIVPTSNLDIHTWNIKIEEGCIRCKTFSGAVSPKKSVTRFPVKNSTIYLVNKINTAYAYQRDSFIQEFLDTNHITLVKCMEKEGLKIDDEKFSQLDDGKFVRYDERIFISPSNVWAIVSDVDTEFCELWINKESDFKRFFRDPEFLKEIEAEFHCVCWDNWNIPDEYKIEANPKNNGMYVSKINNGYIISFFAGHIGLMRDKFVYAMFNGICDKYYEEILRANKNIKIKEVRDFYFNPVLGESLQSIYGIDSRYWEPIEL